MSSYQLSEAVQLAQAGRREEARRLLWQVVQSEPNNDVAWLWLATVAADGNEYQRALNEVLRINPNHAQARQLIMEYQRQSYGQYAPQQVQPPPGYPVQQQPPPGYQQAGYAPQPYRGAQQPQPPKRRGCNGCMIWLLVLVVLPMLLCCGLSYTNMSLGPIDGIAGIFPGPFGRKEVTLEDDQYEITLTIPRSWYITDEDDNNWSFWRDVLGDAVPLRSSEAEWSDLDTDMDNIYLENDTVMFLESNPVIIRMAGTPIGMTYEGMEYASDYANLSSFDCDDVRSTATPDTFYASSNAEIDVISVGNGLCAVRIDTVNDYASDPVLENIDAPDQVREITLIIPFQSDRATEWIIYLSENVYDSLFKGDIEPLIDSIDVNRK